MQVTCSVLDFMRDSENSRQIFKKINVSSFALSSETARPKFYLTRFFRKNSDKILSKVLF